MSKTQATKKTAGSLSRPVVMTGIIGTVVIAVGAFILSFAALADLAVMSGLDPALAWIWPVIVDGLIVVSTVAIVALAGHERRVLVYPWVLLFGGAIVSTAANAIHAILATATAGTAVPPVVSALVASMPPVVLLAVTHLSVILVQKATPAQPRQARRRKQEQPVSAKPKQQSVDVPLIELKAAVPLSEKQVAQTPPEEPLVFGPQLSETVSAGV